MAQAQVALANRTVGSTLVISYALVLFAGFYAARKREELEKQEKSVSRELPCVPIRSRTALPPLSTP